MVCLHVEPKILLQPPRFGSMSTSHHVGLPSRLASRCSFIRWLVRVHAPVDRLPANQTQPIGPKNQTASNAFSRTPIFIIGTSSTLPRFLSVPILIDPRPHFHPSSHPSTCKRLFPWQFLLEVSPSLSVLPSPPVASQTRTALSASHFPFLYLSPVSRSSRHATHTPSRQKSEERPREVASVIWLALRSRLGFFLRPDRFAAVVLGKSKPSLINNHRRPGLLDRGCHKFDHRTSSSNKQQPEPEH